MSKKNSKDSNLGLIIIIVLVLSVVIILVEYSTINWNSKLNSNNGSENTHENEDLVTTKKASYDTSNLVFHQIEVEDNEYNIKDLCALGCNLSVKKANLLFIIKKNYETGEYRMDLVREQEAIFENKSLGMNIEYANLKFYNGYLTLVTKIKNNNYFYDYALFFDENNKFDEISSLDVNEMEFLENGIIYYYDVCDSTTKGIGKKVKAIRAPFSENPAIISSTTANFEWCN